MTETSLIYKTNAKCDTFQEVFKLVAVYENKLLCLEHLSKVFEDRYGIAPHEIKINEETEQQIDKTVDQIVKTIKEFKENDRN